MRKIKHYILILAIVTNFLQADKNKTISLEIEQKVSIEFKNGIVKNGFYTSAGQFFVQEYAEVYRCIDKNDTSFTKTIKNIMILKEQINSI